MNSLRAAKDELATDNEFNRGRNSKEYTQKFVVPTNEKMAADITDKKTEIIATESSTKTPPGQSPFRQLLPFTLCLLSFFTVMSLLICMNQTEFRHQQFRLNMSRDYDLLGVPQDDPSLIGYIRNVHLKKYGAMTTNLQAHAGPPEHLNFTTHHELTPELAKYMTHLLGDKKGGVFIQSLSGSSGSMLTAPWLVETLGWHGFIVEPDPRKYFALRKDNARRDGVEIIHACLSPTGYPKEVSFNNFNNYIIIY